VEAQHKMFLILQILFLASHTLGAKYKTAGLKKIDLGLDNIPQGRVAAFCDFNSDKLVMIPPIFNIRDGFNPV
jgi:hypothetical protein